MTAWNERVLADMAASTPEPPELPTRRRILGHVVLLKRTGSPDGLTDASIRDYDDAVREADRWNGTLVQGAAVVCELREAPPC
jgi:hypothetical protein